MAAPPLNPVASEHLPSFITAPGETDVLMVITAVILLVSIVMFGVLFLRLHHLPEHMASGSKKVQLEIVSVLGLIAMLTHINGFWIAALLLAMINIPDFGGWLGRITGAVERIAGLKHSEATAEAMVQKTIVDTKQTGPAAALPSAKQKNAPHLLRGAAQSEA